MARSIAEKWTPADIQPWYDYMTPQEASQYIVDKYRFACSVFLLKKLASTGGGPARIKAGGRVIYTRADLDAWAEARMKRIER